MDLLVLLAQKYGITSAVAESQVLWVASGLSTGLAQIISCALQMVPPDSLDAGRLSEGRLGQETHYRLAGRVQQNHFQH